MSYAFRDPAVEDWAERRIAAQEAHFKSVKGGLETYRDAVRGWSEADWKAFRALIEELDHTRELEASDPAEWSRRSIVIQRFLDRAPKHAANGTEYRAPWSWSLVVAALKDDRHTNPRKYPDYVEAVPI